MASLVPLGSLLAPGSALAEEDPLPPPVVKDVAKTAAKIQGGCDWMYFELKSALKDNDQARARKSVGSAMEGAYVSPVETELMIPLEQLLSANVNSEEDGWIGYLREARAGLDAMKESVSAGDYTAALESWDKARGGVNKMLVNINKRGEQAYFVELDDQYEAKRGRLYLKKKKDSINSRNQAGNLVMLR
mmetsp:Transcript_23256/g.47101  ORF Transcript_23256/g.47101 Transcript_23256/m.47101 type:complete len:190 (+) Transcript_23256:233-802(+)